MEKEFGSPSSQQIWEKMTSKFYLPIEFVITLVLFFFLMIFPHFITWFFKLTFSIVEVIPFFAFCSSVGLFFIMLSYLAMRHRNLNLFLELQENNTTLNDAIEVMQLNNRLLLKKVFFYWFVISITISLLAYLSLYGKLIISFLFDE